MTLLLVAGADVNAKNDFGATPLIWAAGGAAKSRLLIARGADVNARSKQGRTALMMAARRDGNSELLRLMLAKGAVPDVKDGRGNTALMHASQTGDVGDDACADRPGRRRKCRESAGRNAAGQCGMFQQDRRGEVSPWPKARTPTRLCHPPSARSGTVPSRSAVGHRSWRLQLTDRLT